MTNNEGFDEKENVSTLFPPERNVSLTKAPPPPLNPSRAVSPSLSPSHVVVIQPPVSAHSGDIGGQMVLTQAVDSGDIVGQTVLTKEKIAVRKEQDEHDEGCWRRFLRCTFAACTVCCLTPTAF